MRVKAGVRLTLVAMLATAALLGTTAGPAAALCPAPSFPDADGRVRTLPDGPTVGRNIYSFGVDQTAFGPLAPGEKASFEVKFRNRQTKPRGITIHAAFGLGEATSFRVKVFAGDLNVTDAAFGLDLKAPGVAPGASTPALRFQVKMKASASPTDEVEVHINGGYGSPGFCGDRPMILAGNIN
jgi:hypothetical protein